MHFSLENSEKSLIYKKARLKFLIRLSKLNLLLEEDLSLFDDLDDYSKILVIKMTEKDSAYGNIV